jgi:hypothetical protein
MGFFKKIFKGIKKVVKKIGKGIKSAFKKVGKFMGKLGIIGQIGLALVLPGVGQILSGMLVGSTGVGGLAGALQGMGAVGQAASGFIKSAVQIASNTSKFFGTITDGVTNVIGETIGAVANKIPGLGDALNTITGGRVDITQKTFSSAWEVTQKSMTDVVEAGSNIFNLNPLEEIAVPQRALKDAGSDPFGDVGTVDGITYEAGPSPYTRGAALESQPDSLLGMPPTTPPKLNPKDFDSYQDYIKEVNEVNTKGQTLGSKVADAASGMIDETITRTKERIMDAPGDFIVGAAKTAAYQGLGLSPTPEQLRPIQYSSAVALGDMSAPIGLNQYATSPYQSVINQVTPQFAAANPYGIMAQQYNYNQYVELARARGVA